MMYLEAVNLDKLFQYFRNVSVVNYLLTMTKKGSGYDTGGKKFVDNKTFDLSSYLL